MIPEQEPGGPKSMQDDIADPTSALSPRPIGALIGAAMALTTVVLLFASARVVDPHAFGLDVVFGSNGVSGGHPLGLLFAWGTGPAAAGIAGWLMARHAASGTRWAGTWMGAVTYGLAIVIAPLATIPAGLTQFPRAFDFSFVVTDIPMLWLFSAVLLAPLLVVCVVAGTGWAALLRFIRGPQPVAEADPPAGLKIWPLLLIGSLLGFMWVVSIGFVAMLLTMGAGGAD
jgi:hypothetical protein